MGHRICDTILDFCDPDQVKVKTILEELEIMLPSGGAGSTQAGPLSEGSDADSDFESDGSGADEGTAGAESTKPKKKAVAKKKKK